MGKVHVVIGGSRGLGHAVASGLPEHGDSLWVVSRSEPTDLPAHSGVAYTWIEADLSRPVEAASVIEGSVGALKIDTCTYCAGIWERDVLWNSSAQEIEDVVAVNLRSALLVSQVLGPRIVRGGTLFFIGSTCGLPNEGAQVSAYTATKFGLVGLTHSLREALRPRMVRVTCISPGSIASDLSLHDGEDAAIEKHQGKRMPVGDLVSLVKCIASLSPSTCVKEVVVPATLDEDV